jgi:hypothetical protein
MTQHPGVSPGEDFCEDLTLGARQNFGALTDKTLCRWDVKGLRRRVRGPAVGVEAVSASREALQRVTRQLLGATKLGLPGFG